MSLDERTMIDQLDLQLSNLFAIDSKGKRFIAKLTIDELIMNKYNFNKLNISIIAIDDYKLTNKLIEAINTKKVKSPEQTESIHPWELSDIDTRINMPISLSGIIIIKEDMVFDEQQPVTIAPGTIFKFRKNNIKIEYLNK